MRKSLLVVALVLASSSARADARAEFRRGVELYDKKQYAEALDAFRAAYQEKPSAIIKQNVALSLLGLGRKVEAATAFDEALEEGKATLAPETRAAIERELAELGKSIATLELRVVAAADRRPIEDATVKIDGVALPPGAARRPIRLAPGIHVVAAHVDGFADPPEKKLGFVAGSPVDATFEMGAAIGTVTLRPDVPGALIKIDGAVVGPGPWSGQLTAGHHRIEVTAPDSRVTVAEIAVTPGAVVDYPIAVAAAGDVPAPYQPDVPAPPKPVKRWYVAFVGGYQAENLQPSTAIDTQIGTRRDLKGFTLGARVGTKLSRFFALELHGDAGALKTTYRGATIDTSDTELDVIEWQVTPSVRFSTIGSVRFTTASGIGLHGMSLDATKGSVSRSGTAVTPSWLIDFGAQLDVSSRFYLEGLLFIDVHGVGTLRDETTNDRLLLSSPAARVGLRLGLAWTF